jgi:hypothetical protein
MLIGTTVKATPGLETSLTVTTTFPVVAPAGTGTVIDAVLQLAGVATVPLNVTVLEPWFAPKFKPIIVTGAPVAADDGERPAMLGTPSTVNGAPALAKPLTVTTTFPVAAPAGTGTVIDVELQLVGAAAVPLNVTVLVPWDVPKFEPAILTATPIAAEDGTRPLMLGGCSTVKDAPELATPSTVTITGPVVAPAGTGSTIAVPLQLEGVAAVPLNVTVLVP